jgi:hypothetical protein
VLLALSNRAAETLQALPRDATLLTAIRRNLEWIADDPLTRTIAPPPFPHRQDRLFAEFLVEDGSLQVWGCGCLFVIDGDHLVVTSLQVGPTDPAQRGIP